MGQSPWVRCRVVHGHERESQQKWVLGKTGNLDIAGKKIGEQNSEVVSSLFTVDASSHFVTAIGDLRTALLQLWHS